MQETTYGHFDDKNREYVITNPQTPWPWINYLGNEDFFSLISNTAGGYAFCRDAKFRRITRYRYNGVPMDAGGRYFYIKQAPLQLPPAGGESSISGKVSPAGGDLEGASDGECVWSPGWKPCKTALDSYECRHGMGYTRLTSSKNGVWASVLFFVPIGKRCEVQRLTLTNQSTTPQQLKLFSFQEWCLWNAATDMENFQRNFSTGEVEIDGSVIYHKTEYKERRDHYAFYSVNSPINGFDTDRENFIGLYNGFDAPQVVAEGKARNSVAHGWSPIASHYIELTLQPGESRDFIFILGYVENKQEEKFATEATAGLIQSTPSCPEVNKQKAKEIISALDTVEKVDKAFADLNAYWDSLLCRFSVETQEEKFNRMLNIWNQYQCMVTFCMSRSASFFESGIGRGMGFRDSNQDLLGFVHLIPERARQRIIDIASTQFPDGGCYHQYQPLTRRGNNDIGGGFGDDPLWLIFGTVAYIRETGDFTILDEMVPFDNQEGSEQTLMSHLTISLNHVADNLGPHKLPLIGRADWNDCLNLNCFSWNPDESFQTTENNTAGSQAESLMIAGLFVVAARDYSALCHAVAARKGDAADAKFYSDEAARAEQLTEAMNKAVERDGWDGAWYLRAYDFHGQKVGSKDNKEGQIFIESQGWCAMAEIGKELGMPNKALDSVKERLDSEHGIVLCNPAFTRYVVEYGEISSYPAGYKENAGIFCHNNPWVIIAEAIAGRGADCWHHYEKICPTYTESHSQLHKVEPYVCCQMVAGKDAAVPGEGKNSWLTGTAAWMWYAASQFILGLKPQFDGLEIAPCIPSEWSGFKLTRQFRGATYDIEVDNSAHVEHGIASVTVDGKPVSGNLIPHTAGHHEVKVVMG